MNNELEIKIESVLFWKGEPVSFEQLAKILGASEEEIKSAVQKLYQNLLSRGIRVLINGDKVALGTTPDMSEIFGKMTKEELGKELTKSSLEALAIVLYKKGATRTEIDYIRGVNSSFILRNLAIRGLVERKIHPEDSRKFIYMPTFDLLSFLGITDEKELPDFEKVKEMIASQIGNIKEAEEPGLIPNNE